MNYRIAALPMTLSDLQGYFTYCKPLKRHFLWSPFRFAADAQHVCDD